jgi:hypothetical protein
MVKKTDVQIHHDVLEELKWDSRVDETEVGVQVHNGVVTLTGTLTGWAKRVAAQEAAQRVIGVLDVANDLKINVPGTRTTRTSLRPSGKHSSGTSSSPMTRSARPLVTAGSRSKAPSIV